MWAGAAVTDGRGGEGGVAAEEEEEVGSVEQQLLRAELPQPETLMEWVKPDCPVGGKCHQPCGLLSLCVC